MWDDQALAGPDLPALRLREQGPPLWAWARCFLSSVGLPGPLGGRGVLTIPSAPEALPSGMIYAAMSGQTCKIFAQQDGEAEDLLRIGQGANLRQRHVL